MGRKPSDIEYTTVFEILNRNNCSVADREAVIDLLFAHPDYRLWQYRQENNQLLNNATADEIAYHIAEVESEINNPDLSEVLIENQKELQRLYLLRDALDDYTKGNINIIELHRRLVSTRIFFFSKGFGKDWINSVFEYFLKRLATEKEADAGGSIFFGYQSVLFLQSGTSFDELLQIFFNSDAYFIAQVRSLYQKYLFREPANEELLPLLQSYQSNLDREALLKTILLSNEYLGI
ncbi:MAG: hypothetical protein IPL35_00150 [Sphingobacteriales bacterium]|nr:hypothetical protein [Sphingobacteriales bacterium]